MAALDPALGLLSALTSVPAAFYYARVLGAAAVHTMRDPRGRPCGLRSDPQWGLTLLVFLGGAVLVVPLGTAFPWLLSGHAAFGAVLVAALWPHAREIAVRALLVLLLAAAGAAGVLQATETPASVITGYAIGLCCAWSVRRRLGRSARG